MKYTELDTPTLLIDREVLLGNLQRMQAYAEAQGVALRPHTKTHKMPRIARMQVAQGACGIAVAKVGEAQVMAENGLEDIFIANEIVGLPKLERIRRLAETREIAFGVDTPCQVEAAEQVFASADKPAQVLIEIEVGENRSGIIEEADFIRLLETIRRCPHVAFKGLFSHDGNSYGAADREACAQSFLESQRRTLHFAQLACAQGMEPRVVSIGSTPSLVYQLPILPGITELRPGTYALMDASQAHAEGTLAHCAATVLATVISRPTAERVILDVGAKGITMQERTQGICATPGKGTIWGRPDVHIHQVYDEHAILYHKGFHDSVQVGDKVRILPVHICPVCNLYDEAVLISGDQVAEVVPILCRGKLQ